MLERQLQDEYNQILAEEMLWFYKSQENCVKYGDRNTQFFHVQTIVRICKNRINGLHNDEGAWITNEDMLKEEA